MKDKILYLIIGVLLGAMIATGVFMIINKNNDNNNPNNFSRGNFRNFDGNNMPEGFDLNNLPEGFDVNNLPQGGGQRRNNQGTVDSSQTDSI